jgi:hypothetical protein
MLLDRPPKPDVKVEMSESPRSQMAGVSGRWSDDFGPSMSDQHQVRWQQSLDCLIRFGMQRGRIDEDDLEWPSRQSLERAYECLKSMRDEEKVNLPDSIVPDGEGGIVLEREAGALTERLEIAAGGAIEYLVFQDCQLVHRVAVSP